MPQLRKIAHSTLLFLITITLSACGLIFGGSQQVDNRSHQYDFVRLDKDSGNRWLLLNQSQKTTNPGDQADVAFEHRDTSAIISLNSVCREYRDSSLEELTKNLLMGLYPFDEIEKHQLAIDNDTALSTTVVTKNGASNSETMKIRAVIFKKRGCTYDFMFITKPSHFEQLHPDFERFLKGFHAA